MKIIFAFRTRLSFLSKEKTLYTICYAVVNLLLALLRILTYGNSRVLPALFRFARDSGFSSRVPSVPFSASDLLLQ